MDFTKRMLERFPKLLLQKDPTPFSERGFEVPTGWEGRVEKLLEELEPVVSPFYDSPRPFILAQAKSKFAGLRFYVEQYPSENREVHSQVMKLVEAAEADCHSTCEYCGDPGEVCVDAKSRWLFVACPKHQGAAKTKRELDQEAESRQAKLMNEIKEALSRNLAPRPPVECLQALVKWLEGATASMSPDPTNQNNLLSNGEEGEAALICKAEILVALQEIRQKVLGG